MNKDATRKSWILTAILIAVIVFLAVNAALWTLNMFVDMKPPISTLSGALALSLFATGMLMVPFLPFRSVVEEADGYIRPAILPTAMMLLGSISVLISLCIHLETFSNASFALGLGCLLMPLIYVNFWLSRRTLGIGMTTAGRNFLTAAEFMSYAVLLTASQYFKPAVSPAFEFLCIALILAAFIGFRWMGTKMEKDA
ncbi:MAG: hypothetical protein OXT69_06070 [Candidatus Poribacteria bacterium]|nr:hypothetical protein [Candidatus Poribacteria bacterium]